jgi:hypothetical protein
MRRKAVSSTSRRPIKFLDRPKFPFTDSIKIDIPLFKDIDLINPVIAGKGPRKVLRYLSPASSPTPDDRKPSNSDPDCAAKKPKQSRGNALNDSFVFTLAI